MFDFFAGLALGAANATRHRIRGYRTPRPAGVDATEHAEKVVARWLRHADAAGRRVLEVGPGPDLLTGRLLLDAGATSYTALDQFELADARLAEDRMTYVIADFPALDGVDGEFDLIVSNATLEHVTDVPATFHRLAELSSDDAVWCHYVDAKTHMRWIKDRDPLNLLRYPDWLYRLMTFPGVPNRLRASDYRQAAEDAGFNADIYPGKVADDTYLDRVRTAAAYARDDLALLSFMVVCRRHD